jgi:site-specific recombinase XerD
MALIVLALTARLSRQIWPGDIGIDAGAVCVLAGFTFFILFGGSTMFDALLTVPVLAGAAAIWRKMEPNRDDIAVNGLANLKKFFKNDESETFQRTILNGFDQLISLNKLTYAGGTLRHYKADKQILKNFIRYKYHQDDCILTEINFEFLTSFQSYLIEVRKNKPNTIGKHVQRIRSVINFVIKLDWIAEDPTKNFKVKTDPTSRITLNIGEISALASLELNSNPNLEITRDLFLFMTHTGLSYSDLKALSWNHIDNGLTLIRMSRKKSKEYCVIPLIPQAQSIMNKYKNHPVAEYNSKCFPVFSNQVLNRRLKELGTIAKIDKPITCHIARHSFACISLDNKVPLESISRVLGHTSLKTTQIYAKISASKIEADFQVLTKIFG